MWKVRVAGTPIITTSDPLEAVQEFMGLARQHDVTGRSGVEWEQIEEDVTNHMDNGNPERIVIGNVDLVPL